MDEYILAALLGNKAKTFFVLKPLHGSLSHCDYPLNKI